MTDEDAIRMAIRSGDTELIAKALEDWLQGTRLDEELSQETDPNAMDKEVLHAEIES